MKFEWKIDNRVYTQEFELDNLDQYENGLEDENPWLGECLLDVEAFRQYKEAVASPNVHSEEYYSQILSQYEIIDNIIEEGLTDAATLQELRGEANNRFEMEFSAFVREISPQLHDSRVLKVRGVTVPSSNNSEINEILNRIRYVLNLSEISEFSDERIMRRAGRNPQSGPKEIIRESIVNIAQNYSEESKRRYDFIKTICKANNIKGLYSYDFARAAVCRSAIDDYVGAIENGISNALQVAFKQRLTFKDFLEGLSDEKIEAINEYFDARAAICKDSPYYDGMTGRMRRYFKKARRCVAIMEFPRGDSDNMFSLSGIELRDDKTYNTAFETWIAAPIAAELGLIGHYDFCRQRVIVRRYGHKNNGVYTRLPDWNYLDDDANWKANGLDYSCCERKFLAKLEDDHNAGANYPTDILLWTRFIICDNCMWAIDDYEKTNRAIIAHG